MSRENFLQWTRRVPFAPFEIHTSAGDTYRVLHPEYVAVGRTTVLVFFPDSDRYAEIPLLHVTTLERIELAATAS